MKKANVGGLVYHVGGLVYHVGGRIWWVNTWRQEFRGTVTRFHKDDAGKVFMILKRDDAHECEMVMDWDSVVRSHYTPPEKQS